MYSSNVVCLVFSFCASARLRSSSALSSASFDFAARPPHVFVLVLPSRQLPLHVVAPVLPARLLLVDFAALPKATALGAQNLSPVVTTFRGCELSN
jgi:hypothetical protein